MHSKEVLSGAISASGSGEYVGTGCMRLNMVQILCTYVCTWKTDTC
jgi:hypothetical protein